MLGKKIINIKGFQPIASRPKLIVGVLEDGRRAVFGDSNPLTTAEFLKVVGGTVEPTTSRLQFSDEKQAELDSAEDRLTRASELVDALHDKARRLSGELRAAHPPLAFGDTQLTDEQADQIENIEAQLDELRGRIERSDKLEHRALIEHNKIRQRTTAIARERQFPIEYHKPTQSLDDQLTDLEGSE